MHTYCNEGHFCGNICCTSILHLSDFNHRHCKIINIPRSKQNGACHWPLNRDLAKIYNLLDIILEYNKHILACRRFEILITANVKIIVFWNRLHSITRLLSYHYSILCYKLKFFHIAMLLKQCALNSITHFQRMLCYIFMWLIKFPHYKLVKCKGLCKPRC